MSSGRLRANTVFYQDRSYIVTAAAAASLVLAPVARGADWWEADAQQRNQPTYNDFGETGLLQMPNARIHADSEVAVGTSHIYPYDKYFFNFTPVPWLEVLLRYSNVLDIYYGPYSFSGTQNYKDRSVDFKARLLPEGPTNPDVTLVMRDIGGSGLWSSEYIMASRRYYDFDVTAGIAWGQSATRGTIFNPMKMVGHRFYNRYAADSTAAGSVGTDFFAGPHIELVGGIEWQTPISSLRVKAEYDGNNYSQDYGLVPDHGADPHMLGHSPINVGLLWAPLSFLDLTLARERGQYMASLVLHGNMNSDRGVPIVDTPPPPVTIVTSPKAPEPAVAISAMPQPEQRPAAAVENPIKAAQAVTGEAVVQLDRKDAVPAPAALCEEALSTFQETGDLEAVTFALVENRHQTATITFHRDDLKRSRQLTGDCYALSAATWQPAKAAGENGIATAAALQGRQLPSNEPPSTDTVATAAARLSINQIEAIGTEIFADLEKEKMVGVDFKIDDHRATLRFRQGKYRNEATAIGRAARVVANRLPPQVSSIDLVVMRDNLPVITASLVREDIVRMANGHGSPQEVAQHLEWSQPVNQGMMASNPDSYRTWGWGLEPKMRENMGGPQNFFFFQIYALLQAALSPLPGWTLAGAMGQDLYNNFNGLTLASNSDLPHVRSDIALYLKGAPTWMDSLYTTYSKALGRGFYGGVTVGYMELMYAGLGSELLYKPANQRWAVGIDANRVRQRDFDGEFRLQNYQITTGHASFYYRWPYYDITTVLRAGRFLAGDTGATLEVSRQFDNGMIVGAFATKTNVSAARFGEGSFDKGMFVSIPLDLFVGEHTAARGNAGWRPLTRDGGQMVGRPMQLYDMVRDSDDEAVMKGWRDFGK